MAGFVVNIYFVKISLPFLVMRRLYSSFWCTMTISLLP